MSGNTSILKQLVQCAMLILLVSPVIVLLIGVQAGWNEMTIRQVVGVLIVVTWTPFGVFNFVSGVYRLGKSPENAGFEYFLDVAFRIFGGLIFTVGAACTVFDMWIRK